MADLVALAKMLRTEIYEDQKRWLPDVKGIGRGAQFQRIDLVRFNGPLIEQYRKTLDDIAAELGERVQKTEISGPDGESILIKLDQ